MSDRTVGLWSDGFAEAATGVRAAVSISSKLKDIHIDPEVLKMYEPDHHTEGGEVRARHSPYTR